MADATAPTTSLVRWGFVGCGRIAHDFATAMVPIVGKSATFTACSARTLDVAEQFAVTHGFTKAYGSYEELCVDPDVDVVYIATLHIYHAKYAQLAFQNGKHVIVEKPMTTNAREAEETITMAREKGLFFLEAVWTRFFPAVRHVRELLAKGEIGEVQYVHADIGYVFDKGDDRVWKRSLGGGGLLDIGIYPISFVTMALGSSPTKITAAGKLSDDEKADVYGNVTIEFGDNKFGTVQYSMYTYMKETVSILGSKGRIFIDSPAHVPSRVVLTKYGDKFGEMHDSVEVFPLPEVSPDAKYAFGDLHCGLLYEAEATTNAILNKRTEASECTLDDSLAIQKIMDEVRKQLGVVYDADTQRD